MIKRIAALLFLLVATSLNIVKAQILEIPSGSQNSTQIHVAAKETKTKDIAISTIDVKSGYLYGAKIDIEGTVKNTSNTDTLTDFDVIYTIDSGSVASVYKIKGVKIPPAGRFPFTINISGQPLSTGEHSVKIFARCSNEKGDENPIGKVLEKTFKVVSEIFPKTIVFEEATGTWCGWCVKGIVGLNRMEEKYGESWIGIAVHGEEDDPMQFPTYIENLDVFGFPGGKMNRGSTEYDPNFYDLEDAYNNQISETPEAIVEITNQTWDPTTRNFTIDIATKFAYDISNADYNTALIVIEDHVTGTGSSWNQANYYSGGFEDLIDVDGTNYRTLPDPIPASDMIYNHVARQLVDGWTGTSTIPNEVVAGTPYTYTYTGMIPASNNENYTKYVVIVIDNTSGKIVNATEVGHISSVSGIGNQVFDNNIHVYPNPSDGRIRIKGLKIDKSFSKVFVYSTLGKLVYNQSILPDTKYIDLSILNAGNYILKIFDQESIHTCKLIIW